MSVEPSVAYVVHMNSLWFERLKGEIQLVGFVGKFGNPNMYFFIKFLSSLFTLLYFFTIELGDIRNTFTKGIHYKRQTSEATLECTQVHIQISL